MRVVAEHDIQVHGLSVFPQVRSAMQFVQITKNPWSLSASYIADGIPKQEFFFVVSPSIPKLSSSVEETPDGVSRSDHRWLPSHFMHPFWCMRKVSELEKANCIIKQCHVRVMRTLAVQVDEIDPVVAAADIQFPVIVPCKAIKSGEELLVHWVQRSMAKPSINKRKTQTWHDQEQRKLNEEKKHKAQQAPALFET